MKKNKSIKNTKINKILRLVGWIFIVLAILIPIIIIFLTFHSCERTLTGGCAMGTGYPGMIGAYVTSILFGLAGLITLLISLLKK